MSKRNSLFPVEYDEVSLVDSGAADDAHVLIMKRAACVAPSSTGAKTGKSSQRAKSWSETKHPRNASGQMTNTSSASKSKYGKGGTTSAKQEADCKKKKGPSLKERVKANETRAKKELVAAGLVSGKKKVKKSSKKELPVVKSDSWNTDARLRAIMERKAAR